MGTVLVTVVRDAPFSLPIAAEVDIEILCVKMES